MYYKNEQAVGEGIARASATVPREALFITTKLWHTDLGYDAALRGFDTSMKLLGLDVLDLYLIHWPVPSRGLYLETWRALERLHAEKRVRAIGVSNFTRPCLEHLLQEAEVKPVLNQIELHPWLPQADLRALHQAQGLVTQSWSSLAQGQLLTEPTVQRIAERRGKSPAQVLLRWGLEQGNAVLFRSIVPERLASNQQLFDWELSTQDLQELAALACDKRMGPDPDVYGRPK